MQRSVEVRNAQAAAFESTVGTAPTLEIRTGAQPANTAASAAGTLLVSMALPSDWLAAPSAGAVAKNGTWQGTAAASGDAGHYRIVKDGTCHEHGTVSGTGGGGEMVLAQATPAIVSGQVVTITSYTATQGNA